MILDSEFLDSSLSLNTLYDVVSQFSTLCPTSINGGYVAFISW